MPSNVIIEYTQIGNIVRVTAVDTESGIEAIFQAPANSSPSDLKRIAVKKLQYVLKKQKS